MTTRETEDCWLDKWNMSTAKVLIGCCGVVSMKNFPCISWLSCGTMSKYNCQGSGSYVPSQGDLPKYFGTQPNYVHKDLSYEELKTLRAYVVLFHTIICFYVLLRCDIKEFHKAKYSDWNIRLSGYALAW